MRTKNKKIISSFIILLIFAITVFFIGWTQFLIKPNTCGILTSKTSGLCNKVLVYGEFSWHWERLLPTNINIELFSVEPYESCQNIKGYLPNSAFYASQLEPAPDFSYDINLDVNFTIKPDLIYNLYKAKKISNEEDLKKYLDKTAKNISQVFVEKVLLSDEKKSLLFTSKIYIGDELNNIIKNVPELDNIVVNHIDFKSAKLPDVDLYYKLSKNYEYYIDLLYSKLENNINNQSSSILNEYTAIQKIEKFGEVLKKYPELNELCKNGDINAIINAMNNFR